MGVLKNLKKLRFITLIVTFFFCLNITSNVVIGISTQVMQNSGYIPDFDMFFIPGDLGSVVESFQGTKNKKVICIQDLHCNPEVQRNISDIISVIQKTFKKDFGVIGVEGTPYGKINTSFLGAIRDKDEKKDVVDYFVEQGDVSGAELYTIEKNPQYVDLHGLEDAPLYRQGFDSLFKSFGYKRELNPIFKKIYNGFEEAKKYLYPKSLKELVQIKDVYKKGKISLTDYINILKEEALSRKIAFDIEYRQLALYIKTESLKQEILLDSTYSEALTLERQLSSVVSDRDLNYIKRYNGEDVTDYYQRLSLVVNKNNIRLSDDYTNLKKYFMYLEYNMNIDYTLLIDELEDLFFRDGLNILKGNQEGEMLFYSDNYMKLMDDFLSNKISNRKAEQLISEEKQLFKIMNVLGDKIFKNNYFKDNEKLFKKAVKNMREFYMNADRRNDYLVRNLFKQSKSAVDVIVIGGYHRLGIADVLRSKGISYKVILPKITGKVDDSNYLRRLTEQRASFDSKESERVYAGVKNSSFRGLSPQRVLMVISNFHEYAPEFVDKVFQELVDAYGGETERIIEVLSTIIKEAGKEAEFDIKPTRYGVIINERIYRSFVKAENEDPSSEINDMIEREYENNEALIKLAGKFETPVSKAKFLVLLELMKDKKENLTRLINSLEEKSFAKFEKIIDGVSAIETFSDFLSGFEDKQILQLGPLINWINKVEFIVSILEKDLNEKFKKLVVERKYVWHLAKALEALGDDYIKLINFISVVENVNDFIENIVDKLDRGLGLPNFWEMINYIGSYKDDLERLDRLYVEFANNEDTNSLVDLFNNLSAFYFPQLINELNNNIRITNFGKLLANIGFDFAEFYTLYIVADFETEEVDMDIIGHFFGILEEANEEELGDMRLVISSLAKYETTDRESFEEDQRLRGNFHDWLKENGLERVIVSIEGKEEEEKIKILNNIQQLIIYDYPLRDELIPFLSYLKPIQLKELIKDGSKKYKLNSFLQAIKLSDFPKLLLVRDSKVFNILVNITNKGVKNIKINKNKFFELIQNNDNDLIVRLVNRIKYEDWEAILGLDDNVFFKDLINFFSELDEEQFHFSIMYLNNTNLITGFDFDDFKNILKQRDYQAIKDSVDTLITGRKDNLNGDEDLELLLHILRIKYEEADDKEDFLNTIEVRLIDFGYEDGYVEYIKKIFKNQLDIINLFQEKEYRNIKSIERVFRDLKSGATKIKFDDIGEVTLEPYSLYKPLGKGAFGKVRMGRDDKGNFYAVKVVDLEASETALTSLDKEIEVMTKLKGDKGVVKLHDAGYAQHDIFEDMIYERKLSPYKTVRVYMLMQLLRKGSLHDMNEELLGKYKSDEGKKKFKKMAYDVGSLISNLHFELQYVHGDIKSQNIMIDDFGNPILIDFGESKPIGTKMQIEKDNFRVTPTGTPRFYAPSMGFVVQQQGLELGGKEDVWAFGGVICEMFGLAPPITYIEDPTPGSKKYRFLEQQEVEANVNKVIDEVSSIDQNAGELLRNIFVYDSDNRPTMTDVLKNSFFSEVRPVGLRTIDGARRWVRENKDRLLGFVPEEVLDNLIKTGNGLIDFLKKLPDIIQDLLPKTERSMLALIRDISQDSEITSLLEEQGEGIDFQIKPVERADILSYKDVESILSDEVVLKGIIQVNISEDMLQILLKARKIFSQTQFKNILIDIIKHEIREARGESHNAVVTALGQEGLLEMITIMERLNSITEISADNYKQAWQDMDKLVEVINRIGAQIDLAQVLNIFSNIKSSYVFYRDIEGVDFKEVVISLENVNAQPGRIRQLLGAAGVLDDEGKIVPQTRVVFVGDFVDYEDVNVLGQTVDEMITLSKTTKNGNLVFSLGPIALDLVNTDTKQGEAVSKLVGLGIAKPVTRLIDGTILSGSGYLSKDVLDSVQILQRSLTSDVVDQTLQTILQFRSQMIAQVGFENISIYSTRILTKDDFDDRVQEFDKLDLDMDSKMAVKLLSMSWMIFDETSGIVSTTDSEGYEAVKAYKGIRQRALGIVEIVPKEIEFLNSSTGLTEKRVVKRSVTLDIGFVLRQEIIDGTEQPAIILEKPVTEVLELEAQELMLIRIINLVKILVDRTITEVVDLDPIIDTLFSQEIDDRAKMTRYKTLAAAA